MRSEDEIVMEHGLGRIVVEDACDRRFLIQPRRVEPRTYRYWWPSGWWGDQGMTPQCVAYSWLHWLEDGPVTQPDVQLHPPTIYREAQRLDQWEGENYDGTSIRAGAKALQKRGHIGTYRWAWDVETLVEALLYEGPVVVGTRWHWDMVFPDEDGLVTPTGPVIGGHAYVANGVNVQRGVIRFKNSWGRAWGRRGYFYMRIEDVEPLIDDHGEVCLAEEI